MKVFFRIWMLGIFGIAGVEAIGQPGLGQFEVKVTERYKAQVAEAVKLSETPDFKDTITSKLPVNYRISSEPIDVRFEPEPISFARIKQVPVEELSNGLARLGFGLYVTPIAEVYWNSGRSSDKSYGFWGRHFSTVDGVKETAFSDNGMSQNEIGGYYNRFYRNMKWETELFAKWNKYSYYGVDAFPDSIQPADDFEEPEPQHNWYRQYAIKSIIEGEDANDLGALDRLGFEYYNFSDIWKGRENFVDVTSQWLLPAGEQNLDLGVNMTWFGLGFDSIASFQQSYFTVQARPKVTLLLNDLLFDFGFNLYGNNYTSDSTGGGFNLHFFPEIKVRYPFVEDVLSGYAGIRGQLQHNTFRSFAQDNPYIVPAFISRPTRTMDIYLGVEGIISSTTSFNLRGGYMRQRDLVLYYRDPNYRELFLGADTLMRPPGLDLIYDNSETFYARGELSLNVNDNLQLGLYGELRAYNMAEQAEAWHRPSFLAGLNSDYTFREKLKFGAQLDYIGKREAFVQEQNPAVSSTLPAYLDATLNFEYLYNSRLSGFVKVANLLNQHYDLYLGYKAQSINFMMGFSYKF